MKSSPDLRTVAICCYQDKSIYINNQLARIPFGTAQLLTSEEQLFIKWLLILLCSFLTTESRFMKTK